MIKEKLSTYGNKLRVWPFFLIMWRKEALK